MKIKIGTRESRLAVAQAELIQEQLRLAHPGMEVELVTMKTTGDRILDKSLDKIGGKGLFVKELDMALREGRIDLAVHSLKDLPMEEDPAYPVLAFSAREDERDVLVLPVGETEWDKTRPVGCSSFRRRIQLERMYPGIGVEGVRGNVLTRLEKLDRGEFGALVLAAAGLKRLGLKRRISRYFAPNEMIPAAGQGVLAVQGRRELASWLTALDHPEERFTAVAERAFVRELDGGCSSPVAAWGRLEDDWFCLRGLYYRDADTPYRIGEAEIPAGDLATCEAEQLGRRLADALRREGQK